MISQGNTGAISHTRALPIPTKAVGYEQRTPVRSGHVPIKCGTPRGYERHRELGTVPCKDCLKAVNARPLEQPRPRRRLAECGTKAGYDRHVKRNETTCEPCKEANRAYRRDLRARQSEGQERAPRKRTAKCGTYGGYRSHKRYGEDPCQDCKDAAQEEWRNGTKRRDVDRARLLDLHGQGLTNTQIARELGVSDSGVSTALGRLGLVSNLRQIQHGTYGGWKAEQRRKLDHCEPCIEARRAYDRETKRRAG